MPQENAELDGNFQTAQQSFSGSNMEKGRLDSVSQCASEIIEISEPAGEPSDTEKNNEDKASTTADSSVFNKETIEKKQLYLIIFGLVMLYFVAALDTTILATVYIDISSQYDDLTNGIWIITSYLLSTTAVQPLYGKFSDITGRLEACIASVLVFCLGSVLCAVSHSMTMLIACRAVQGIGGGGLMAMVSVILSDTTTERDRGKYTGFLAGSWGIASAIGPVLGGAIVENASWRIIFWINLPVCIPTIAVLYFVLKIPRPQGSVREKLRRIDFAGALVFQCCIIPILIAFAWGGQGYKWVSGRVLGTIGGGVVMGVLFIVIEWRVSPEPIVPLRLFRFRNVTASTLAHFFLGACTYAPMMFIPSWELAVKHSTEIKAGLHLIPMMCSMVISAALSGILMTRTGRYRPFIWIGGAIIATGNTLLILLDVDSNNGQRIGFIFLTGIGLGFTIQTMIIAAQCAVKGGDMAVITTLVLFARTLGGIFSLSILSSVFNNGLRTESAVLAAQYPQYATTIHNSISDQSIVSKARDIPDDLLMGLTTMFQKTLHKVFIGLIPFSGLFVLSTLLFAHVDLNVKRKKTIK